MFGLNYSMHYYLCTRCVDMRNGINGLSKIVCPRYPRIDPLALLEN
jgi:hypothetical protein